MFRFKGPALAGLFFVLIVSLPLAGFPPAATKLSPSSQQYFRTFLETFTPLVLRREKQGGNPRWGGKNRDCAGLVRYLFWEALQPHADAFLDLYPEVRSVRTPDARALSGVAADWSQKNFTAAQLIERSRQVGRDPQKLLLKTGDLMYFYSTELRIRHVMLVVRSAAQVYLVYHTGDARNELRIRTLADIAALPESEWHPEASNPVFRGVYRPAFLE